MQLSRIGKTSFALFCLLFSLSAGTAAFAEATDVRLIVQDGHADDVTSFGYTQDGRYLVSASKDCSVKVWRTEDGALVNDIKPASRSPIRCSAIHPNGDRVAFDALWTSDVIVVHSLPDGRPLRQISFESYDQRITALAYSPDGKQLLYATEGRGSSAKSEIVVLDDRGGVRLFALPAERNGRNYVWCGYTADGKKIVTCSAKGWRNEEPLLRVYSASNGELLKQADLPKGPSVFALSPDGKTLAVSFKDDKKFALYAVDGLAPLKSYPADTGALSFSKDGKGLYYWSDYSLSILDLAAGTSKNLCSLGSFSSSRLSPDGKRLGIKNREKRSGTRASGRKQGPGIFRTPRAGRKAALRPGRQGAFHLFGLRRPRLGRPGFFL